MITLVKFEAFCRRMFRFKERQRKVKVCGSEVGVFLKIEDRCSDEVMQRKVRENDLKFLVCYEKKKVRKKFCFPRR